MADLSDVEDALVGLLNTTLLPSVPSAPSLVTLANGSHPKIRIFAGWPEPNPLDADLANGVVNVSVFPQAGSERNTTRYPVEWKDQVRGTPTITASVSGPNITFGGTVTAGNYVTVVYLGQAFSYSIQAGDTLAAVATALAALISPSFYSVAIGSVLTIAGQGGMVVRIGAPGTVIRELERVNQRFMVSVFASTNDARQATARLIRIALAEINFLALADTSQGRIIYENSQEIDEGERVNCYRRSIFYWVEYPTTSVAPGYPITVPQTQLTASGVLAVTRNS